MQRRERGEVVLREQAGALLRLRRGGRQVPLHCVADGPHGAVEEPLHLLHDARAPLLGRGRGVGLLSVGHCLPARKQARVYAKAERQST